MLSVVDQEGNTPIHFLVKNHKKSDLMTMYLSKLHKLCQRYPEWLFIEDQEGETPLITATKKKDVDGFIILSRFMSASSKNAFERIVTTRKCVGLMIDVAMDLLNKKDSHYLTLLLQCFDYFQIFYFPSKLTHIDNHETEEHGKVDDSSLVAQMASKWESTLKLGIAEDILFRICGLKREDHHDEYELAKAIGTTMSIVPEIVVCFVFLKSQRMTY